MIRDRRALIAILDRLALGSGRWVVTGSAPMLVAGLVDFISDVDVVADRVAWLAAVSASPRPPRTGLHGDRLVSLEVDGESVEVFDGWLGDSAEALIAESVEVGGFRFSPLERVLDSKRRLRRDKDLAHIGVLEAHLSLSPEAKRRRPTADGRTASPD